MAYIDYPMMCSGRVTEMEEAKMDEKATCNHDERFKGVLFTTNGCLACELEKMVSENDKFEAKIKELESERDSETRWAKQYAEAYFDQWEEVKARIKELSVMKGKATWNLKEREKVEARIKELVNGIERHRAMNLKVLHSIWDDELYKLIEKESKNGR